MMRLSVLYFGYLLLLHMTIGVLTYFLLGEQKWLILFVELGIMISFSLSIYLYHRFVAPIRFIRAGGDAIKEKDFQIKYRKTGAREMDKLIGVYNDMIDNIRKERIFQEEQHYFLNKLIQASPNGIILLDYDDQVEQINPKALEMLNLTEEVYGEKFSTLQHHAPILKKLHKLEVNKPTMLQGANAEKWRCEIAQFIHRGFARKFIILQELSLEVLAAEKQAYGKVIRMMAHEVNNSIGAINSILESTIDLYKDEGIYGDDEVNEALAVAVDRNNSLKFFMHNFAQVVRLPNPQIEQINLTETLRKTIRLMSPMIQDKNITILEDIPNEPVLIFADEKQIQQVLINILKNSVEAINSQGTIKCQLSENGQISILDNGSGILPEDEENLFSPFFSTKATGQGIGLTLIKEILLNHKAAFSLKTKSNGWTVFKIQFATTPLFSLMSTSS